MTPQVSVLVPSYNYASKLALCLESVLAQDHPAFELVVSDDASTDDSDAVIRRYRDPRLVYERQPKNLGMVPNWRRCVAMSRGEYLLLLGADDYLKPGMLRATTEVLERGDDIAFCHTAAEFFTDDGRVVGVTGAFTRSSVRAGLEVLPSFVRGRRVVNSTAVFRRSAFEALGGWSAEFRNCMDLDLWFRMLLRWRVGYVGEVLVGFRAHPTSPSWQVMQAEEDVRFLHSMYDRLPPALRPLEAERGPQLRRLAVEKVRALRGLPVTPERDRVLAVLEGLAGPVLDVAPRAPWLAAARRRAEIRLARLPARLRHALGDRLRPS